MALARITLMPATTEQSTIGGSQLAKAWSSYVLCTDLTDTYPNVERFLLGMFPFILAVLDRGCNRQYYVPY